MDICSGNLATIDLMRRLDKSVFFVSAFLFAASAWGQTDKFSRYFNSGWSKIKAPDFATVKSKPVFVQNAGGTFQAEYARPTHIFVTEMAYQMYSSQFGGGEMAQYLPKIVKASYEEDMPFKNPFGQLIPELRHFWDPRRGLTKGLAGYDSAVDRAYKYFTGGYGINGKYDPRWSVEGTKGQGIIFLYRAGEKAQAYEYLGHVAHLLEDLTVPAHTLLWPHLHAIPGSDAYETYAETHFRENFTMPSSEVESFSSLYDIFNQTARTTQQFDAGFGPGPLEGKDGTLDRGQRRKDGFTPLELQEEARVLLPLAVKRVAALFLYFQNQAKNNFSKPLIPSLK